MSPGVLFNTVVGGMLLPPFSLLLLALLGAVLMKRHRRTGRALVALSLLLLALLSTPATSWWLVEQLQARHAALIQPRDANAQAIVILGGNRIAGISAEYAGKDQPGPLPLGRLRYGAHLHQQTGLPVLVSGGSPGNEPEPEATLMARTLRDAFKVPTRWEEPKSRNTAENATESAKLLRAAGVTRILLVTDATHMPRAVRSFSATGLDVVPAPTFLTSRPAGVRYWIPGSGTLDDVSYALHEWLGMVWYRLRHADMGPP